MSASARLRRRVVHGICQIACWVAIAAMASAQAQTTAQVTAKNAIVIVADDLGYGELGCYGGTRVPTPHLDAFAGQGIRFTQGYVSCPVCSPTRAGLLTGKYQQRFGHEFNPGPPQNAEANFGLPLDQKTLANYAKDAGLITACVGKWHLGYRADFHPLNRGFDEYFGFLAGANSYRSPPRDGNPILRGRAEVTEPAYLTTAFSREAVAFIERNRERPFFLYLPYNAVHAPLQPPADSMWKSAATDPKRQKFEEMLWALDHGIGEVLKAVHDGGLDEETIIFFISDNGGPTPQTTSSNGSLRGYKSEVYEGGIRVPMLVRHSGTLAPGQYDRPVIALDILPTIMASIGHAVSQEAQLDGVNLVPYLQGQNSGNPHDKLFWRFGNKRAIRQGDWKLLKQNDNAFELYDLAADPKEANNLAAEKPETVQQLKDSYQAWDAQLAQPLWRAGRQPPAGQARRRRAARENARPTPAGADTPES